MITPQTDVYLLKVPLEIDSTNQLTFNNAEAQFNYFYSLPKLGFDNFTYQRKDGVLRIPELVDNLMEYNYVMYRNEAYSSKWFYAYITALNYLSDGVTAVSIKTDTWQTWQFALEYKPCLIDREHTNDDTIGANTLPEGLELGEMVANGPTQNFGVTGDDEMMVVADVTMIENYGTNQTLTYSLSSGGTAPTSYANGIPSGCYHVMIGKGSLIMPNIQRFVALYDRAGLSDAIQTIYILPYNIVDSSAITTGLTLSTTGSAPAQSISDLALISSQIRDVTHMVINASYRRPNTLDGYQPKNNKMYCFPFSYMNVSNNAGTVIPYRYEDFHGTGAYANSVLFEVDGAFCPSGSIKAVPRDYKNLSYENEDNRYDFAITGAKYPICSWVSDSYTNWLTQSAVNREVEWRNTLISGGVDLFGGAITGGASGVLLGGTAGIKSMIETAQGQMLAKTRANFTPDQAHSNVNAGDVVFSKHGCEFTFMPMSVKAEYARCCDEYLSQFGYKTNRVKVPNVYGRRNWNFVKTVGCYIKADIPQGDLQEIKSMFDRGITFWHNPATFADYSQNNDII